MKFKSVKWSFVKLCIIGYYSQVATTENNKFFYFLIVLIIAVRFISISYVLVKRHAIPAELDDSLAYMVHAGILDKDPSYQSELLKSFSDLHYTPAPLSWAHWYNNRIYHHLTTFYHSGHALLFYILKKITGLDYFILWWFLLFLFNALLILFSGLLIKQLFSKEIASLSLAFYGFSFLIIRHHMTAAPREWAELFFIITMYLVLRYNNISFLKGKLIHAVLLFISMFCCLSFHSVGVILILEVLAINFLWMAASPHKKELQQFTKICLTIVLVYATKEVIISYMFGVPQNQAISMLQLDFSRGLLGTLRLFSFNTLSHFLRMSFANLSQLFLLKTLLRCFLGLCLVSGIYLIFSSKNTRASLFCLVIILVQIGMHFVAINYKPYVDIAYYEEYHFSIYLIFLATAGAVSLMALLEQLSKKKSACTIASLIFLIFTLNTLDSYHEIKKLSLDLADTGTIQAHPKLFVTNLEKIMAQKKMTCVIVNDEIPLYSLMLYGNYSYKVSYNYYCPETASFYSNSISPEKCDYMFVTTNNCSPNVNYKVLQKEGTLLLAEIVH